jgi:hypothetical protein
VVNIVIFSQDNDLDYMNRQLMVATWTQIFILLICTITLGFALIRIRRALKRQENLQISEKYMALHVFLLVGSLICLIPHALMLYNDSRIVITNSVYLLINQSATFVWAFFMNKVAGSSMNTFLLEGQSGHTITAGPEVNSQNALKQLNGARGKKRELEVFHSVVQGDLPDENYQDRKNDFVQHLNEDGHSNNDSYEERRTCSTKTFNSHLDFNFKLNDLKQAGD